MIPAMTHKHVMMSGAFPVSILALRYRGLTLRVYPSTMGGGAERETELDWANQIS